MTLEDGIRDTLRRARDNPALARFHVIPGLGRCIAAENIHGDLLASPFEDGNATGRMDWYMIGGDRVISIDEVKPGCLEIARKALAGVDAS